MASELNMYESQVAEYKYDIDRLSRDLQEAKKKYFMQKKKEQQAKWATILLRYLLVMLLLLRKYSIFGQLFTDFCSSFSLMQKECRSSPAFGHICYTQWRIQEDAGDATPAL